MIHDGNTGEEETREGAGEGMGNDNVGIFGVAEAGVEDVEEET